MDITTINSALPYDNILENMLKSKQAEIAPQGVQLQNAQAQEAQLPVDTSNQALSSVALKAPASTNLMAQNFANASQGESKYIQAKKNTLQSDKNMINRQNSILASALAEKEALGENASSAKLTLIGKKAARLIKNEMYTSTREEAEKYLEESRKKLAQKTEEALAPKDANGNPIPELEPELPGEASSPKVAPEGDIPSAASPENNAAIDSQAQVAQQLGQPEPAEQLEQAEVPAPSPGNKAPDLPQLDKYV